MKINSRLFTVLSILFLISFFGCSKPDFEEKDLKKFFDEQNVSGCFLLYDFNTGKTIKYNPVKCDSGYLPASTFKIPHSLIALELGIIPDTSFTLKWDGQERFVKRWNKDHNFKSALQNSVVWYYEEIGKRVGNERMEEWLDKFNYGNKNTSGNYPYWLIGDLRITPNQQLKFIKDFYFEKLPFSKKNISTVKEILLLDKNEEYTLTAKTGWANLDENHVGWLTGYLETNNNTYIFVTNITSSKRLENFSSARLLISKQIFSELKLIKN